MTTVTGLTADRMLAIEAASVIDGDVDVNGNLILTKHDGSKINAGNVVGPPGPVGPVGQDVSVISAKPVLEVGITNQIRAGRQLSPADFANIGLAAPAGLWNLSDLTDASGNGRNLQNKGAVGFTNGINGGANTAAQFTGAAGQVLYIPDTGANDPFRLRTGTIGCWFRTAKKGSYNMLVDKYAANVQDYCLFVTNTNQLMFYGSPDGVVNTIVVTGITDVTDDRWHFGAATFDGTIARLYLDGVLEGSLITGNVSMNPGSSVLNIGGRGGDASNNTTFQNWGRIDEAFITQDVLSEEQIRNLYCAKLSHTLGAIPSRISLRVRRRRKGASFVVADYPTQPLRLHNFSGGSMADEGSNAQNLTNNGGSVQIAGVDGTAGNSMLFYGPTPTTLSSTDAGLPAALAARSMGAWIKSQSSVSMSLGGWGAIGTDIRFIMINGAITAQSGADAITGPSIADGQWHFVVVTEDNAASDGAKRKLYVDGKLVGISAVMNGIVLGGANRFRIGANPDLSGTAFTGDMDGVFVTDYALTTGQILNLWAKGSQTLAPSPKNSGDHVEAVSATDLLAIFDSLDSQHQIDLSVA